MHAPQVIEECKQSWNVLINTRISFCIQSIPFGLHVQGISFILLTPPFCTFKQEYSCFRNGSQHSINIRTEDENCKQTVRRKTAKQ